MPDNSIPGAHNLFKLQYPKGMSSGLLCNSKYRAELGVQESRSSSLPAQQTSSRFDKESNHLVLVQTNHAQQEWLTKLRECLTNSKEKEISFERGSSSRVLLVMI